MSSGGQWLQSRTPATTLWSGPDEAADGSMAVPAGSVFWALEPPAGARLHVVCFGNSTAQLREAWVDVADLEATDPPPGLNGVAAPEGDEPPTEPPDEPSGEVPVEAPPAPPDASDATTAAAPAADFEAAAAVAPAAAIMEAPAAGGGDDAELVFEAPPAPAGDAPVADAPVADAPVADSPLPAAPEQSSGQWLMSHAQQTTLWSGADEAAVAFALVPQWSIFRQLAPQQGWRIFVQYFGNSTAQAGVAWVDALNVGPVGPPPDPESVGEPEWEDLRLQNADARADAHAEPIAMLPAIEPPAPAEQWYQNHVPGATLWSGADEGAVAFAQVPQWSWFKQLAPQQGGRIFVEYFGNSAVQRGNVWVDAENLGPVPAPPDPAQVEEPDNDLGVEVAHPPVDVWYQNQSRQVTLWSGADDGAQAFTDVPPWSLFKQLAPQQGGRIFVEYFGNSTAQPGSAWLDAAEVVPIAAPADPDAVREPEWGDALGAISPPQWYQNHVPGATLWSGPNDAAVAFTQVPQWSWFKGLAPPEGPRIFVQYFGNSVAQPGAVWVDATDLGPVLPPPNPDDVREPEPETLQAGGLTVVQLAVEDVARAIDCPQANVETCWPLIGSALDEQGIADRATEIAAIATVATEVPAFLPIDEFGSSEYFTRRYENRWDLGNVNPGDGARYHGRGFIQLTGRHNYRVYGQLLGVDLENNPELAKRPDVAARVLALYFRGHGIQELAATGNWTAVRERVNGGSVAAGTTHGWRAFLSHVRALEVLALESLASAPQRPHEVPLVPCHPWDFDIFVGCAMYAQTRRPSLGPTGGHGGAADYLTKFCKQTLQVTTADGDLRDKIARGFAVVWDRQHPVLSAAGQSFGHVAIVEEVGADYVVVSQAGVGGRTNPVTYPSFSMRMQMNRPDLEDQRLYFIS